MQAKNRKTVDTTDFPYKIRKLPTYKYEALLLGSVAVRQRLSQQVLMTSE